MIKHASLLIVALLVQTGCKTGNTSSAANKENPETKPSAKDEPSVKDEPSAEDRPSEDDRGSMDVLPAILYSVDRDGKSIAILDRKDKVTQDEFFERLPLHLDKAHPVELAKAVNHFARQFKYEVIDDLAEFEKDYRATLAGEDQDANWQQGRSKLSDYGMPDFAGMAAPGFSDSIFVFYAKSIRLRVPYRVEVQLGGKDIASDIKKASYKPVTMGSLK